MGKKIASSPLKDAIDRLVKKEPHWKSFDPAQPKGPWPGAVSVGRPSAAQSSSGGGVGDLVELDYTTRQWWPDYTVPTTDGVFSLRWRDPKRFVLDNGGVTVNLDLAQPT